MAMVGRRELTIFILKRILFSFFVIIGTIIIIFLISHTLSRDPAALWAGPKARPSTIAYVTKEYGLNRPLYIQLLNFFEGFFSGNFGTDPVTHQPVASEIFYYFPNTIELVITALIFIIIIGVGLGYISAVHFNSKIDNAIRLLYTSAWATPTFLASILAVLVFTSYIHAFPSGGMYTPGLTPPQRITGIFVLDSLLTGNFGDFVNGLDHLILPSITLAFLNFGIVTRISRSGILNVKWMPYVKNAKAKGVNERSINRNHILRNGLIESNTVIAVMFGWLVTGTVVVEEIFSWPGIGRFAYNAITSDDYPALIYVVIIFTILVIIANLIADIMYAILDPRIRLGGTVK